MTANCRSAGLFGTDGVRGPANTVLTPDLAMNLGRAGAFVLGEGAPVSRLVIGRDTRASGPMLAWAAGAGIMSAGLDLIDAGVFPTPGIAFLARALPAAAGLVISASHNPFEDNGLKFFSAEGAKLSEEREREIERFALKTPELLPRPAGRGVGRLLPGGDAREQYLRHVVATATCRLDGFRILVDCAHGATTGFAREVFERLGAEVHELAVDPDGENINRNSGSTHPEVVAQATADGRFDVGLAFDGDGDRLVAADRKGKIADGDEILAICALDLLSRDMLPGRAVAATVMSNLALDSAVSAAGGRVFRTAVGDRQVYAAMRREGLSLGGEQSGHLIFLDHHTTGDGLVTAVQLLDVLVRRGVGLEEVPGRLERFPQVHRSVHAGDRELLAGTVDDPGVRKAVERAERSLGAEGRVILRPSGTEPVVRIMVEARNQTDAERLAGELVRAVSAAARSLGRQRRDRR